MKKSIFLFFAAILCAMSVSAKVIYFKPNGNWAAANAAFYASVWGGAGVTNPVKFTPVATDPDVYEAEVGTNTSIIFLRHDPAKTVTSSNMWDCWNRMGNLSIPTDGKNCCTIKDGQWSQEKNTTNGAASYVTWSTYTPPTEVVIPDRYITGTLAGGWNANDQIMTYDPETETYSHTFTAVAANVEQKFKVTDGTWSKNWGGDAVSPAIEGVTKDNDGNAVFTLSTGGDVTVTFDGTNIQLTTTGEIKVTIPDRYIAGIGGWSEKQVKMTYNEVSKLHEHTFAALAAGNYEFKITDGTWTNSWGKDGQNYPFNLPAAGDVTIKYNWKDNSIELILPEVTEPEPEPTELTYNVTVPAGTKACYICGNMTGWNFTEMTKVDDTHYTITIEGAKKNDGYKYASGGDWGYVEKDANGNEIGDRTYVDGNDVVAKWASVYDPDAVEQELTYSVTVPEGTYACYIAMDTDPAQEGWEFTEMTKVDDTHYTFTRTGLKSKTYKYASGAGWEYVEKTAEDGEVADRTWAENDVVAKWASVYNPSAPTYDYYLTGSLVGGWDVKQQGIEKDGELYKATFNALAAGTYEFKITAGDWEHQWNYNNLGAAYEEVSQGVDGEEKPNGNIKIITEEVKNITVIFDATAGKITFDGLTPYVAPLTYTVTVPAGTEKCYIAGAFAQSNWNTFLEMEQVVGEDKFTITIIGAKETDEYKYACQADWAYAEVIDGGGNRTNWSELDEVTAWNKPVVYTYYLMGVNGDWTTGIEMEVNTGAENEVMLTCQPVNGEVKIKRLGDDESEYWYGGKSLKEEAGNLGTNTEAATDGDGNIALEEGIYNFYFNTADGKLWIAAATDCELATITLTTGNNDDIIAANIGETVNVKIERSFTANDGYYTLCVPFNMDPSVIGKAYYLGTITEHVAGEGININLEEETYMLSAGVPYLVLPKANMSELVVENVTIQPDIASGQNVTNGEGTVKIFFEGFYSAPGRITNGTTEYYVGNNGYLYNGEVEIRGLSGLFTITDENGAPLKVRARVVTREDEATGFENITNGENTTIKLIENGQLIIIRNGEKFNAQGQKL